MTPPPATRCETPNPALFRSGDMWSCPRCRTWYRLSRRYLQAPSRGAWLPVGKAGRA